MSGDERADESAAARRLARARRVILDFDGPICHLFAGHPAAGIAAQMRIEAERFLGSLPRESAEETDPHRLLVDLHDRVPGLEAFLSAQEEKAAATAVPTPGAAALVRALSSGGRGPAVASNNCASAVRRHLADQGLLDTCIPTAAVIGRDPSSVPTMKPAPHLVLHAASALATVPADCVMIGDSENDVLAARSAGVPFIGYASRAEKYLRLRNAGADIVIDSLAALLDVE